MTTDSTAAAPVIHFDNTYVRLPAAFHARLPPTPVKAPRLIQLNDALAERLGLDGAWLRTADGLAMLSGNAVAVGSEPLAQAYAGHQFGGFVPQLGDGRAILLGEVMGRDAERRDIQLKGAGPTPYSRSGDGRAALGPVLREYIVSEAMAALGVPTTRSLAAVLSGEIVLREDVQPGAILTRVAASHIRVGTFQYFAARNDQTNLARLADYVIARHYPALVDTPDRVFGMFEAVMARQAALIAQWMGVGFIHGVMNTDNMTVSGETIDYGPCAFMDAFDPSQVYSSIDRQGRYAYGNQPRIAQWNLARLAETLLPFFAENPDAALARANAAIATFPERFEGAMLTVLRTKLGLAVIEPEDGALANGFLKVLAEVGADFTNAWRGLGAAALGQAHETKLRLAFSTTAAPTTAALELWLPVWRQRLAREGADAGIIKARLDAANPAVIPRNHRIEATIRAAVDANDFAPFEDLVRVLSLPFALRAEDHAYANPPLPNEVVARTFCGT